MLVDLVDITTYSHVGKNYLTVFDTPEFNVLNKSRCDELLPLLFKTPKLQFGMLAGLSGKTLKLPFSAPYSSLTLFRSHAKVIDYHNAVRNLVVFAQDNGLHRIEITLPPAFYDPNHISTLEQALIFNEFKPYYCDLNYHFPLSTFNDSYVSNIKHQARKNLNSSLTHDLKFERCDTDGAIEQAYQVIKENRASKGYPLKMSLENLTKTSEKVKIDYFMVSHQMNTPVAAAVCFFVKQDIVQVVYWGNLPDANYLRPMNFLSYRLFEYYKKQNIRYIDIGPSTEKGSPNFGLCDFKQSIGCIASTKYTFGIDLN